MAHKIAILGASGYTGAEMVRLVATHPNMEIVALTADHLARQLLAAKITDIIKIWRGMK